MTISFMAPKRVSPYPIPNDVVSSPYRQLSIESQKGITTDQQCSFENQKGTFAVQSQWR